MGRGNRSDGLPDGAAQRGLWRLMLKLPAVRGRLQILAGRSEALDSLCEAYEDASSTLERVLREPGDDKCPLVEEYRTICSEIETDVVAYCLKHRSNVLK
ncbi:hypothetical protein [Rhizobium rhizogenes]|uniref:hypothetical protein n=1 Tax=Rhizobium rhizogenes TaxID=359 RepID=UPI0015738AC1|nr:hypothetical protein [Rhizobium rhizogenes]NTI32855.1 hypothetical protein [Rhizobium rhizogenes]